MKLFVTCTFISTMVLLGLTGKAQRLSITASEGASNFKGDLANGDTPPYKNDFSIGTSYDVTNRYRLRLNLSALGVEGNDALSSNVTAIRNRNLNFKSNIQEAALLGEYDLVDNSFNSIIPYLSAGLGVYHFDPHPLKIIDTAGGVGGNVDLHSLGTEGQYLPDANGHYKYADRRYNLTQLNVQLVGGVRFEISDRVSIAVEANYRRLFTDYLDDVSTNSYISKQEWQTGIDYATSILKDKALALKLQQAEDYSWRYLDLKGNPIAIPATPSSNGTQYPRGNPSKNDAYYSFQIRLNIRLFGESSGFYTPSNPNGRRQLRCARVY